MNNAINRSLLICFLISAFSYGVYAQGGTTVDAATQFCATTGMQFTLGTGGTAESGPDYGCLWSQPTPNWFFFKIDQAGSAGTLEIKIFASQDVDFILYGPNSDLAALKTSVKNATANIEDCSYSGAATEYANLSGASSGDYYILLVTNFAGTVQTLNLQKNGGTASTDCGFAGFPNVSTTSVNVSGVCNGNVTADNGNAITERGFVYSTSNQNPSLSDNKVVASSAGTGTFSVTITPLTPGATYYCAAYATNSAGTSFGSVASFSIPPNTPPVANNDTYTCFYTDTGVSFTVPAPGVLANDTDADSDPLTVGTPRPATGVSNGSLTLNANGSFTYTSNNGFKGSDSFTYYANDGTVNSNSTATVTINVVTPRFVGPGNNFNNPTNWNTRYVPPESLDIIIAAGQHINFNTSYTCKNLTFESATSSFSCTSPNTLTITGNVYDGNGKMAIEVTSSLVVSSSIEIPQSVAPF